MSREKRKPGMWDWIGFFVFLTLSGRISGLLIHLFVDSSSDHYKAIKFFVWVAVIATGGVFWKSRYVVSGRVPTKGDDDL